MRSVLAGLKGVFSRWTILDKRGTDSGVFQHPYTGVLRRGEQAGLRALNRARKCRQQLAGRHVGSVRLSGVAAVGMVWSQPAAQEVAWDGEQCPRWIGVLSLAVIGPSCSTPPVNRRVPSPYMICRFTS